MYPRQKEIVWTSELAYAVGLITTDGNLSGDGRHFDFTSNDIDLIETFKKCLQIKNRIVRKRSGFTGKLSSYRVQFGNVTLHRWLCKIGLMPNKSKRMQALSIPDNLFFHFLRGHLDGDGSIKRYQDSIYPKSTRLYTVFISASLAHILWIKEEVRCLSGITGFTRKTSGIYSLTFSKYNSIKLLNLIYPKADVPHLQRKFEIAKEFLNLPR